MRVRASIFAGVRACAAGERPAPHDVPTTSRCTVVWRRPTPIAAPNRRARAHQSREGPRCPRGAAQSPPQPRSRRQLRCASARRGGGAPTLPLAPGYASRRQRRPLSSPPDGRKEEAGGRRRRRREKASRVGRRGRGGGGAHGQARPPRPRVISRGSPAWVLAADGRTAAPTTSPAPTRDPPSPPDARTPRQDGWRR